MKSIASFITCCLLLVFVSSCRDKKNDKEPEIATRTVLMYLIADNNISTDIYRNIEAVEKGLLQTTTPGTFVIYWDGGKKYSSVFPTPTLFKYVVGKDGSVSNREVIQTYSNQNSCSPEVMTAVINDVKQLCKAQSYGLIFGSHATGWLPANTARQRSLGDDDGYKIEIPELSDALSKSGVHFDFIMMDACLMSQVEVAYELRNNTDYLLVSPAEVMAAGFPYNNIVKHLLATDDKENNIICAARSFIDFYKTYTYKWATIAVVKTSEMDALASLMKQILEQYNSNLSMFDSSMITTLQRNYGFGRGSLSNSSYDVNGFLAQLTNHNIPTFWFDQLKKTVVYTDFVDDYTIVNISPDLYSGIGCYVPAAGYVKWNNYFHTLQWYKDAGWSNTGW